MSFWQRAVVLIGFAALLLVGQPVGAESLRVQPLQYKTELKKGERKKGFIDVTNPSNVSIEAKFYVQGFRQVDNKGNLTFFKSEQLEKGLLLDYESVEIAARKTLRLFFIADGTKLPTGDVFGVIFAETLPLMQTGAKTAVRVGSLIMLTNQTPGSREAEITDLTVPFFQIGNSVRGSMVVKNPAPKGQATGHFPDITVGVSPWGKAVEHRGPLIFAGIARTVDFEQPSNAFGVYQVKVQANNAAKTATVFLITGWWQVVAPLLLLGVIVAGILIGKYKPYKKLPLKKYQKKSNLR